MEWNCHSIPISIPFPPPFHSLLIPFHHTKKPLSVLGRDAPRSVDREMSIVSGSGVFRFARGYVRIRTYLDDIETGVYVEEHDVSVFHS
ncbi:dirigent protein 1-like [Salvia divinorum]|uniref:Dirigent protein n=1 Tax=Salvia divinorum TaxID=28513 RepID=A0ABD1HHP9_SALDI